MPSSNSRKKSGFAAIPPDWSASIGASAYVGKPLDIEDLLGVVAATLAKT